MSKLVDAIAAHDTGYDVPMDAPLREVVTINSGVAVATWTRADEYRIGVTIEARAIVPERPGELAAVTERAKRHIVECIFGEFRRDFIELGMALAEHDFYKAREVLDAFKKHMFEIGPRVPR